MSKTRVAVIGVGHLGQHHARLLAGMGDAELIGVVDSDTARAEEIAARYGTRAWASPADLLTRVDAVSIAAPTVVHVELALPFVEAGIAVLIEKPIAASVAEADRLLAAAARRGGLVAAGHTERFNPAVAAAMPLITAPRFIEIHRLGTFPERSLDIDVVFDLMIHDLDLLLAAVGSSVESIEAVGVNVLTPRTDIANVRLRFASGCIANLTASRISRERVRKARFFQPQAYVSIDYAAQEVEVYRIEPSPSSAAPGNSNPAGGYTLTTSLPSTPPAAGRQAQGAVSTVERQEGRPVIQGGRLEIVNEEPLKRELADFVEAVRTGRQPLVTGRAGREALALATRIAELM